jgi:Ca2+-binding EF-hand superfamily protein
MTNLPLPFHPRIHRVCAILPITPSILSGYLPLDFNASVPMGSDQSASSEPTPDEYASLAETTHLTRADLVALFNIFHSPSGSPLTISEFQTVLNIQSPEFAERLFAVFDKDGSERIEFSEFAKGVSSLSRQATLEERTAFFFDLYDSDRSGHITTKEFAEIVRLGRAERGARALTDPQIHRMVECFHRKVDFHGDGKIGRDEFYAAAAQNPTIVNCFQVDVEALIRAPGGRNSK